MESCNVLTNDLDIDAALSRVRGLPNLPRAVAAEYLPGLDAVHLKIDDGRRLIIPREELQGLEDATSAQLAEIEIYAGLDIAWPQLDVDHYLPHLLDGRYATEEWKHARRGQQVAA